MGEQQPESLEERACKAKQLLQVLPQPTLTNLVHFARCSEIDIVPIKGINNHLAVSDLLAHHR